MRITKLLPFFLIIWVIFAILGLKITHSSQAETNAFTIGSWTFDEADFADNATVLDPIKKIRIDTIENCSGTEAELGTERFEECVNLALTGYTPETYLFNVGLINDTGSNYFQLDFTDVKATNHFGPDIVLFECRFGENSYEVAVHPENGEFTEFQAYDASDFVDPDDPEGDDLCSDPFNNWGLPINLSDFGIPADGIVDAIQFKVIDPDPLDPNVSPQGEPSMAAVLVNFEIPTIYMPIIVKP